MGKSYTASASKSKSRMVGLVAVNARE